MKTSFKAILRTDLPMKGDARRIDFRVYFESKQYKFSTPKFIEPKYWDSTEGKVICSNDKAKSINNYILGKIASISKYILQKDAYNEYVSIDDIRAIITDQPTVISNKKERFPLDELLDMYILHLRQSDKRANTIRKFLSLQHTLKAFTNMRYKKNVVTIGQIDYQFIQEFANYLRKIRKNNQTTTNKGLKNFRTVWYFAIKNDFPIQNPFKHFKLTADARRDTYLNFEEYDAFKRLVIPPSAQRGLFQSKELFVFACETGLRYSDVIDLKWKDIDENFTAITKIQIKNSNKVYIPISNVAKKILNKRSLCLKSEFVFEKLSNQYINKNLKEMANMLDIDKKITFHVARHTFGSHLGIKGVAPQLIMTLLGDKDMKQAYTYINMDSNDIMKQAMNFINMDKDEILKQMGKAS